MAKKRYIDTRDQSFFGNYIYDQVVPQTHFLRLLNELINWDPFTVRLIELYRGGGEYGRPPFNPAQLLKMCLLAYFYDLSERQVEVYVNENMPAKYFVGLGLDQSAPDHSTLSRFRERLTQQGNLEIFEHLLTDIVQIAVKSGIQLGSIQVIDREACLWQVSTVRPTSILAKTINEKKMGKGSTIRMRSGGLKANNGSRIKKVRMWIK